MKGIILGGRYGEVIARQKSGESFELGELLIAENEETKVLCQVYDLLFGSQVSQQNRELVSGMRLEENTKLEFLDKELREYTLAYLREMLVIKKGEASLAKSLPGFFSELRDVKKEDFYFLNSSGLYLGDLRSGTRVLDVPIHLDAKKVLSHHILIPATTGRGKSNLLKTLLWDLVEKEAGILVLDPHDEYYRPEKSLRAHPKKDKLSYYSPTPLPGTRSLRINLKQLKPKHFDGSASWTAAQREALGAYYKRYGSDWIKQAVLEADLPGKYHEATLGVVQRRLRSMLSIEVVEDEVHTDGIFTWDAAESTINDVLDDLEKSKTVVVDTSSFSGSVEILIGSIFSAEVLARYKRYKQQGTLRDKPVISLVLEEAPRVLGKEVLENGPNIFSTVAREGRKFQVGLIAITQLPSLIPRQILANMNTKIILGIEMRPERQAIIDSASQDLSQDDRAIASLDKGEAIVTTNFSPFAIPIKIPFFDDWIKDKTKKEAPRSFSGLKE